MAPSSTIRLKTVVDSLDGIPEAFRSLYTEGHDDFEGRYVLDVDEAEGFGLANSGKLTGALHKERTTAKAALKERDSIKAKLEALEQEKAALEEQLASGVPDAKTLREQLQAQLTKQFDSRFASTKTEFEQQLKDAVEERDTLAKQFEEALFDASLGQVASGGKFKFPVKVLAPHIRGRTRIEKDDTGRRVLRVLDANGEPKFSNGRPATLEDLIADFARDNEFGSLISRPDAQGPDREMGRRTNGRVQQSTGQTVVLNESELTDFKAFENRVKEAEAAGKRVIPPQSA